MAELKDRPDYESTAYKRMKADVKVMRDVVMGGRHLKDQGEEYLPKHAKEERRDYTVRLHNSVLFNGTERTVDGLAGMVFAKDPVLQDVPGRIEEHLENIDNAGTHFDVFSRQVFSDALEVGHAGILVEVPAVDGPSDRPLTEAEEAALGVRPYWCHYRKEDILSWRSEVVAGRTLLSQLVLREKVNEADGEYGDKEVTYYRVLRRTDEGVTWERLRIDEDDDTVISEGNGPITNQDEIPFVAIYGGKTGLLESRPPLLDLAETNLAHYRLLSDHLYKLHLCNLPVGVLIGVDPDTSVQVGPNAWLKLPQSDMKFSWESPDGSTFKDNVTQLQEFKADMAAQGLSLLQVETRQAETATAKRMDKAESDSALAAAARSLQDGLEKALEYHANYMRLDGGGSVQINRDFENVPITPDEMRALSEQVASGQLSLETMWAIQEKRGGLPDDFDPEVEKERIASETPSMPMPEFPSELGDAA